MFALKAKYGWYRYDTRFAIPKYDNDGELAGYNVFKGRLVIRHAKDGKLYLYDVLRIKKETSEPCVETTTNVGHNCTNRIIEYTPDAEVTYAVNYGVTQEDGLNVRNILQELLPNLLN